MSGWPNYYCNVASGINHIFSVAVGLLSSSLSCTDGSLLQKLYFRTVCIAFTFCYEMVIFLAGAHVYVFDSTVVQSSHSHHKGVIPWSALCLVRSQWPLS